MNFTLFVAGGTLGIVMRSTCFAVLLSGAVLNAAAQAQAYPQKPVRLVVPFAPGGTTDILARLIGQKLTPVLGQTVFIDNRPGANGAVGSEIVARSAPDGYTLLMGYLGSLAINPHLFSKLPYDSVRDFAPVTLVAATAQAIVVHPALPATCVELIALAKRQRGQITYASAGIGSPSHLAGEMFKMLAGVDIVHVPYKGSGAVMSDLLGGHVAMSFGGLAAAMPYVKAGRLRLLAVTSARRSSAVPNVPTVTESGVPGFDVSSWFGVLAPAATPREAIDRLHMEIARILSAKDVKERLAADGAEPVGNTPQEFAGHIRAELEKWGKVVKGTGLRPE